MRSDQWKAPLILGSGGRPYMKRVRERESEEGGKSHVWMYGPGSRLESAALLRNPLQISTHFFRWCWRSSVELQALNMCIQFWLQRGNSYRLIKIPNRRKCGSSPDFPALPVIWPDGCRFFRVEGVQETLAHGKVWESSLCKSSKMTVQKSSMVKLMNPEKW